jgi:hypothetical protein
MRRLKPQLGYRKKEREKERRKEKFLCIALNTCINSPDRFDRQLKEFRFCASKGISMCCLILSFFGYYGKGCFKITT